MLKIGLTGGIGCGKSSAAKAFVNLGVITIDLDQISREVVQPGTPCLTAIIDHFGSTILSPDNSLDRLGLGAIIFNDAAERIWLEQLLHPAIKSRYEEIVHKISKQQKPTYIVVEIPLLTETNSHYSFDRILVIDLDEETQIQRTMQRSNLTREEVEKRLANQASRNQRLALADDVIENKSTEDYLGEQVKILHARYLQIAELQTEL